jgi:hypothetical protein
MPGKYHLDSQELDKPKLCRKDAIRFRRNKRTVHVWGKVSSWGKPEGPELHEILAPNQVPEGVGN